MQVPIRPIGNSKGVVLPKPILAQAGLEDATEAEISVENGVILLRKPVRSVRAGWVDAAKKIASVGDDAMVMGEFGNDMDEALEW